MRPIDYIICSTNVNKDAGQTRQISSHTKQGSRRDYGTAMSTVVIHLDTSPSVAPTLNPTLNLGGGGTSPNVTDPESNLGFFRGVGGEVHHPVIICNLHPSPIFWNHQDLLGFMGFIGIHQKLSWESFGIVGNKVRICQDL